MSLHTIIFVPMIITKNIEVRFRDIDSMGHVNNAVYLNYFEQARMKYFNELIGAKWDWNRDGIVIARQEIDYKLPVFLNDSVGIKTWCSHMGTTSITFNYSVQVLRNNEYVTTTAGKTVVVCFNNQTKSISPVPEVWKEKIRIQEN